MMHLMDFLLDKLAPWLHIYLRPFIKWFLHIFTRLCELQRIVYGAQPGARRSKQVERSLELSKNPEIKNLLLELDKKAEQSNAYELLRSSKLALFVVCNAKDINQKFHPDFPELFGTCVLHIWSYRRLVHRVERIRAEQYDSTNREHKYKLLHLWNYLNPRAKAWKIKTDNCIHVSSYPRNYKGEEPIIDFRDMGLLGLENLLYFASQCTETATHLLSHSQHPNFGYAFETVCINITELAVSLLKTGAAKTHFYNLSHSSMEPCSLDQFHKFYCCLFIEFDRMWMRTQERCTMDFDEFFREFELLILEKLNKDRTIFKMNLTINC